MQIEEAGPRQVWELSSVKPEGKKRWGGLLHQEVQGLIPDAPHWGHEGCGDVSHTCPWFC